MHGRSLVSAVAILASLAFAAGAQALQLDRTTELTIALPDAPEQYLKAASRSMSFSTDVDLIDAVEDLRKYLSDVCGVSARVVKYGDGLKGAVIHVGTTPFVEAQKIETASLDIEGYVIRIAGGNVVLAGRTRLGTRHAIYAFLERHVGIRWYFPLEIGTYVPKENVLVLRDADERSNPAFLSRYFTLHAKPDALIWERRNRVQDHWTNRLKGNSHAMAGILPGRIYAKDHPEYYALVNNERRVPGERLADARAAYCLTQPAVADICARWAIDYFDKNPSVASVSMAMNDTTTTCQCDTCRRAGVVGATDGPNYSDLHFTFVNTVARRLRERHPDKVIGVLAYGPSRTPPNRLKRLEDNVNIYLVTGSPGAPGPAYVKAREDLLRGWVGLAPSLCVYTYQFGSAGDRFYQIPAYYPHLVHEDLTRLHALGVKGYVVEMLPVWPFSPRPWLMAKWLWDPSPSCDDLMGDFCRKMFGKAGDDMRRYFELLEKAWTDQPPGRSTSGQDSQYDILLPVMDRLEALLASAERAADSDAARSRVRFYADGLKTVRLFAASAQIAGRFTPFPASGEDVVGALEGAQRLYENEKAIESHRERLEKEYGIGRGAIAPRDKTATLRTTVAQCARWMEKHNMSSEAKLLLACPAARFGAAENSSKTGEPDLKNPAVDDAIPQVLARKKALLVAGGPSAAPRAPVVRVRYVDRADAAVRSGARLLLRESFDGAETVEANDGETYGTVQFQPGIEGQSAFLSSQDAMVSYPLDRVNATAGTIEFFLKTQWAGRDEDAVTFPLCTGGNFDAPGHISVRLTGKPGERRLSFTIYADGATVYALIPLKDWPEGTWRHVAAMWRVDAKDPDGNLMRFFLDGKESTTPTEKIRQARDVRLNGSLAFGNRPVRVVRLQSLPLFALDELRIYDRPVPVEALSFSPVERKERP